MSIPWWLPAACILAAFVFVATLIATVDAIVSAWLKGRR